MAKIAVSGGNFQDAEGNALAGGLLVLTLDSAAVVIGTGQVVNNLPLFITLDSTGNAPSTPIWFNDQLTPSGTAYSATLFSASGKPAWTAAQLWQFLGGAPINLDTMVPTSTGISYPSPLVTIPTFATVGKGGFWAAGLPEEIVFTAITLASGPASNGFPTVWQFVLESNWTISSIGMDVISTFSATFGDVGIYSAAGALLLHSGPVSMAVAGPISTSITPVTLSAGTVYYLASGFSYTGCLIAGFGAGTYLVNLAKVMNLSAAPLKCAYGSTALGVNGALPASFGTLTDSTSNLPSLPAVFFGV